MLFSYGFHWPEDLGYSDLRFNDRYYQMIDRSYQVIDRSSRVTDMSYQILLLLFTGWKKTTAILRSDYKTFFYHIWNVRMECKIILFTQGIGFFNAYHSGLIFLQATF